MFAANKTGSDGSTVDDGVSSDNLDDRRAKVEVINLHTYIYMSIYIHVCICNFISFLFPAARTASS